MKEKPILFSGEMVRAILDGRKTQTRRILKDDVLQNPPYYFAHMATNLGYPKSFEDAWAGFRYPKQESPSALYKKSPYGKAGDRLWVRETWAEVGTSDPGILVYKANYPACVPAHYENIPDENEIKWKPSIHMNRRFSRINLEIVNIRVERLNAISEDDAKAEGMSVDCKTPKAAFSVLWNQINLKNRWEENPWVWVIEFKQLKPKAWSSEGNV